MIASTRRKKIETPEGNTCGPCHSDAACKNGCTPGSERVSRVRKAVAGYQNAEVVLRIAEKAACSIEEADKIFEEAKQYLSRAAVAIKASSPTKREDLGWHEFILFTQDYAQFCDEYFGHFIHHVPTPRLNTPAKNDNSQGESDCSCGSSCGVCRAVALQKGADPAYCGSDCVPVT